MGVDKDFLIEQISEQLSFDAVHFYSFQDAMDFFIERMIEDEETGECFLLFPPSFTHPLRGANSDELFDNFLDAIAMVQSIRFLDDLDDFDYGG